MTGNRRCRDGVVTLAICVAALAGCGPSEGSKQTKAALDQLAADFGNKVSQMEAAKDDETALAKLDSELNDIVAEAAKKIPPLAEGVSKSERDELDAYETSKLAPCRQRREKVMQGRDLSRKYSKTPPTCEAVCKTLVKCSMQNAGIPSSEHADDTHYPKLYEMYADSWATCVADECRGQDPKRIACWAALSCSDMPKDLMNSKTVCPAPTVDPAAHGANDVTLDAEGVAWVVSGNLTSRFVVDKVTCGSERYGSKLCEMTITLPAGWRRSDGKVQSEMEPYESGGGPVRLDDVAPGGTVKWIYNLRMTAKKVTFSTK